MDPVKLKKFSQVSTNFSETATAVQRSESEEDILPLAKALTEIEVSENQIGEKQGRRGSGRKDRVVSKTGSIMKTMEVEVVHEYDDGDDNGEKKEEHESNRGVQRRKW